VRVFSATDTFAPLTIEVTLLDLGYPAKLNTGKEDKCEMMRLAREKEVAGWWSLLLTSLIFAIPVALIHFVLLHISATARPLNQPILGGEGSTLPSVGAVLTWILTTPVQFYVGARFFRGAWNGMKHCNFGMDFLVAFGTGTAYFYSILSIVYGCTNEVGDMRVCCILYPARGIRALVVGVH
jgi:Cu+-exporting ATPase